jgi:hypothetical protein
MDGVILFHNYLKITILGEGKTIIMVGVIQLTTIIMAGEIQPTQKDGEVDGETTFDIHYTLITHSILLSYSSIFLYFYSFLNKFYLFLSKNHLIIKDN